MKKTILSLCLLMVVTIGSTYAHDRGAGVSQIILTSFKNNFAGATNVAWENDRPFVKAIFSYNSQILFAYFDTNGDLIATARNILSDKLPINLILALKKEYPDCWISALVEMDMESNVTYYITVENASKKYTLQSVENCDWEVFSKSKKI
jgi:hypothetical protein